MKRLLASFRVIVAMAFLSDESGRAQAPTQATFTAQQARQGRVVYEANCASCHGPSLSDGTARPLIGRDFKARWSGTSPAALRAYIRRQMPPGLPGTLSTEQYTNLVALLMNENGLAAGDTPLPGDETALLATRFRFPGTLPSSGGLAASTTLPPWPKTPHPTMTPVTDAMLKNPPPGDWLAWRRTQDGLGFSPLAQITVPNVSELRLVWSYPLAPGANLSTPLVHDGVIFVPSTGNLDALNAKTGELIWNYTHESSSDGRLSVRNIALYDDKVYLPMGRGYVALDARTGKLVWESKLEAGTSAGPLIANGKIFQGLGRGANPAALGFCCGGRGSMLAMDAKTGKSLWHWFTIPKSNEPGGNTWGDIPDDKRTGGGIWTSAYFDYDLNLVYFGTGNTYDTGWLALPTKTPGVTKEALFTNTTVAMNSDTGKVTWYFQHQAADPFDLDYVFERTIVPLIIEGKTTKAVVTMGKPGILDALDAATGKYLFSLDAGVQNFVTRIDPVTGAKTIDPKLIPVPGDEKVRTVCPNWIGVKNWLPGAINPNTKVAYMALNESCMDLTPVYPGEVGALSSGVYPHTRALPTSDGKNGRVQAFDLQNRKVLWLERQRAPMTSGVLATGGGVVFAGALDRTFSAYDEKTGKKLWSTRLGDVPSSAPISYSVDGKQYVAMVVGFGSMHSGGFLPLVPEIPTPARPGSAIYVFALP